MVRMNQPSTSSSIPTSHRSVFVYPRQRDATILPSAIYHANAVHLKSEHSPLFGFQMFVPTGRSNFFTTYRLPSSGGKSNSSTSDDFTRSQRSVLTSSATYQRRKQRLDVEARIWYSYAARISKHVFGNFSCTAWISKLGFGILSSVARISKLKFGKLSCSVWF